MDDSIHSASHVMLMATAFQRCNGQTPTLFSEYSYFRSSLRLRIFPSCVDSNAGVRATVSLRGRLSNVVPPLRSLSGLPVRYVRRPVAIEPLPLHGSAFLDKPHVDRQVRHPSRRRTSIGRRIGSEARPSNMPRDMTGTGRYPPQPKYPPFAFYSCVRLGDPEQLAKIMEVDPYFWTQDNGAGAPVHFATTYRQLDMLHHILNNGGLVNQKDSRGMTPLHRAAYLAQYDGYLEIYEYLLSRGADPSIQADDWDPYLNPGRKTPVEVAPEDENIRNKIYALEKKYAGLPKEKEPHPDIGDWWALYDYGLDAIKTWDKNYKHPYPEEIKRKSEAEKLRKEKEERKARRAARAGNVVDLDKLALDTPVAFLFPGQGSQAVGMLEKAKDIPAVQEMLAKAEAILGYNLLEKCIKGPKEDLDNTIYSQPALFVAGLAAVELLRAENPAVIDGCSATAGLSLGEYTALCFGGYMTFEEGMKLVKVRAESMAEAAQMGEPHGMLSVVGLNDSDINSICSDVKKKMGADTVIQPANYLFPQGRVISGHKKALEEAAKLATAKGALKAVQVAVSGAFHTKLMEPASEKLAAALADVQFKEPRITVYSNVTAKPFGDPSQVAALLKRQLCEPVQWEQTMKTMIGSGKNQMFELGPGQQLKAMCKRMDANVWKAFKNVQP